MRHYGYVAGFAKQRVYAKSLLVPLQLKLVGHHSTQNNTEVTGREIIHTQRTNFKKSRGAQCNYAVTTVGTSVFNNSLAEFKL
jgi:hypothetical protein